MDPGKVPSLDSTFGALLLGGFVTVILYGVGVHQFYRYMRLFPTDAFFIRVVAIATMLLATCQTALIIHACYYYLVTNYFKPQSLNRAVWSANTLVILSGLVAITAQSFFARRVSLIGFRYKILAATSVIFMCLRLVTEILLTAKAFTSKVVTKTFTEDPVLVALGTAAPTIVDVILSGAVFSVMWNSNNPSSGNDTWIDLFIMYGINTGFLLLVFDFLSLVLGLSRPHDLYWVIASLIATRLTMNTIFCVLNSRKFLVSRGVMMFDSGSAPIAGASIISRVNRLATVERWNVPQDPRELPPAMIDIKVTREMEGDSGDGNSIEMTSSVGLRDVKTLAGQV